MKYKLTKKQLTEIIKKDRINLLTKISNEMAYGFEDWYNYPINLPKLDNPG